MVNEQTVSNGDNQKGARVGKTIGFHGGDHGIALRPFEKAMTVMPCVIVVAVFLFIVVLGGLTALLDRLPENTPTPNFNARNWRNMQAEGALKFMKNLMEEPETEDEDEEEAADDYRFKQNEQVFILWETCPPGVAKPDCDVDPFSDEILQRIATVERKLVDWDQWEGKYCSLHEMEKNTTHARCFAPFSFMNYVHQDEKQTEMLMRADDKGEEMAIDGQFDYFGAMCLPYTKTVSDRIMLDIPVGQEAAGMAAACDENGNPTGSAAAANASAGAGAAAPDPDFMAMVAALQAGQIEPTCAMLQMTLPANKSFSPEDMGLGDIAKMGVPPCDSMAYYWWKADFKEGAGKQVLEGMCSINQDTKTKIAEVLGGSTLDLPPVDLATTPLGQMGVEGIVTGCQMAGASAPGFTMIAPVFADFSLMRRDFTLSADLVEEAPYTCTKDRRMEMMRSMYFVGVDMSSEPEANPNGPPPEVTQGFKDMIKPLWDKCGEIIESIEEMNKEHYGKFRGSLICGERWIGEQFLELLDNDVANVSFSAGSCLLFMALRCGFVPALAGIGQIILSIVSAFLTWGLLGFEKVTVMQQFLFFIIMGIGSAACFVLYDAWAQEKELHKDEPDDIIFARAYRRAVPAILLTSCTTMMGFLSAGMSNIPGIATFGFFAALVIIYDFFYAITLFAATFYFCETNKILKGIRQACLKNMPDTPEFLKPRKEEGLELGAVEMIFHGPVFALLKKFGAIILILYLLFTAGMGYSAAMYLRTSKEATPFLSSEHPIQIFISHLDKFSTGTDGLKDHVSLVFGLGETFGDGNDNSRVADFVNSKGKAIDPDDVDTLPKPIFGGSDVLQKELFQQDVLEKCDAAKESALVAHKDAKGCVVEKIHGVSVYMTPCRPGVTCVMQPLKEFVDHFADTDLNWIGKGWTWPLGKNIKDALESKASIANLSSTMSFIDGPMMMIEGAAIQMGSCDPPIVFKWKTIEGLPDYTPGFLGPYGFLQKWLDYQQIIGDGFYDIKDYYNYRSVSGWHVEDDELKAMWIRYNATIGRLQPLPVLEPKFQDWTKYTETFTEGVPVHICDIWGWYITQVEMIKGVVGSIGSCAVLSWLVLAAGTANWILATFAVGTIISIIVQVMGTLVWFNNPIYQIGPGSLGIIETIGLSIAIGMAVDYTVHIVNAYNNCPAYDREARIRFSMTLMGISITNGMIATNLSALFLLMCLITFFTGFGTFIMMTIFYSWLSAFFILCPALLLFGPQGQTGEIGFLKKLVGAGEKAAEAKPNGEMKVNGLATPVPSPEPDEKLAEQAGASAMLTVEKTEESNNARSVSFQSNEAEI